MLTIVFPTPSPYIASAPFSTVPRFVTLQVPHKTPRGTAALKRLELYEGVPPAQDRVKKMVVPAALRVLRLKPGRKVSRPSYTLPKPRSPLYFPPILRRS